MQVQLIKKHVSRLYGSFSASHVFKLKKYFIIGFQFFVLNYT